MHTRLMYSSSAVTLNRDALITAIRPGMQCHYNGLHAAKCDDLFLIDHRWMSYCSNTLPPKQCDGDICDWFIMNKFSS